MQIPSQETRLFREERLAIHKLLSNNPNYFGTATGVDLPVVQPIKFNTTYEELTCVGLWPERNLLEATILVKLPFGFLGEMCSPGSYEYVRFFIDWDNDGDFSDLNEDVGVAAVNVHDIPQVREFHLCYAVRRPFRPFLADCRNPYIVKMRAILSWEIVPPPGDWNFIPIWGNVHECWIQIDPVEGRVLGIVPQQATETGQEGAERDNPRRARRREEPHQPPTAPPIERERAQFLELVKANPNYFGTLPTSELQPVNPIQYDTRYEELKCIGLYPEGDFLEAILEVKLPYGFLGDLCSPGSYEYVRFFIDWTGDGDFVDFNEDVGVAAVNVHDIPQVREFHLCYALGRSFHALRANCQRPYIVKVRAILSWQQVPTGPNFIPVWGNVVECWVQIRPTEPPPDQLVAVITSPATATPPTCASVAPTATCGLAGVTIVGSAGGGGFASYRIEYRPLSSAVWSQAGVVYPDCSPASSTPDHTTPRFAEPLAFLTNLQPDEYEVRLTVNGLGGPVSAFTTFSLQQSPVVIDKIGQVDARVMGLHPVDPTELLKLVKLGTAATDPQTAVGGSISVVGSADFWGCGREMIEYVLQHRVAPLGLGSSPQGPPPPAPSPAPAGAPPPQQDDPGPWTDIKPPLPFGSADPNHPRWYWCWPVNLPNFVLNGKLTRIWINDTCLLFPPSTMHSVRRTAESAWSTPPLNGRYTVRLRVRHQDLPHVGPIIELYDAATVWLDNRDIQVDLTGMAITGGVALDACQELSLSQFLGTTADIIGRAWDPLILDTEPSWLKPNDNFDHYAVDFAKDGGGYVTDNIMIPNNTLRVPNELPALPAAPNDVGVLATWDIVSALDAGPPPSPYVPPPYPKIYRGERCAYIIHLFATDNAVVSEGTTHHGNDYWPFCIVNDLPLP
ncbi:MAG: hypothetical protein ACRERE_07735 [Candidatus Entotheonellia bacterium]